MLEVDWHPLLYFHVRLCCVVPYTCVPASQQDAVCHFSEAPYRTLHCSTHCRVKVKCVCTASRFRGQRWGQSLDSATSRCRTVVCWSPRSGHPVSLFKWATGESVHDVIRWRCIQTGPDRYPQGAGIAQCVERRTEKPGAILTRVRVPRFSFSFPVSAFSADSLTVSAQPPCAIACINICADVNNPKHWQPYHCLDTRKHAHTGSNG